MIDVEFVRRIKKHLNETGKSNKIFAAEIGVSAATISGWLLGKNGILDNNRYNVERIIGPNRINQTGDNNALAIGDGATAYNTNNNHSKFLSVAEPDTPYHANDALAILRDLQSEIMLDDDIPADIRANIYKKIQTKITEG